MTFAVFGVLALLVGAVGGQMAVGGECPQAFGDFGDPDNENCTSFVRCVNNVPHQLLCPADQAFHFMLSACRPRAEVDCARQMKLFTAPPLELALSASQILDNPKARISNAIIVLQELLQIYEYEDKEKARESRRKGEAEEELPRGVEFLPRTEDGKLWGSQKGEWEGPVLAEQVLGAPDYYPQEDRVGGGRGTLPVGIGGRPGVNRGPQRVNRGRPGNGLAGLFAGLGGSGLGLPGVLSILGGGRPGGAGGLGGLGALGGLGGLGGATGPSNPRTALMVALVNNIIKQNKAKAKARARAGPNGQARGKGKGRARGLPVPTPLPVPDLERRRGATEVPGISLALGGGPPSPAARPAVAHAQPPFPVPRSVSSSKPEGRSSSGNAARSASASSGSIDAKPAKDPAPASGVVPAPDKVPKAPVAAKEEKE